MLVRALAAGAVLALLAGCGGSGRLSAAQYRTRLAAVGREANAAQRQVELGLRAKNLPQLRLRLTAFAAADDRLGGEVGKLKPPKDAEAANAELTRGEHDTAEAVRAAVAQLAKQPSVKSAIRFLNTKLGPAKGGHEVDHALTQLAKLGYTKGS